MIVVKCDITCLEIDIIVNAANNTLLGGGGVDGVIHYKAGEELRNECAKLNGCETGEAKITSAYNLFSDKIIHTVGPVYKGGEYGESELLKNSYLNSMLLAENYRKENNIEKIAIAFPCISTGVYGYPKEEASKIAIDTIKKINNSKIKVIFACHSDYDYQIYLENLQGIKLKC
ncbi:MAG: macro domain-containing protein [Methanobacteriaceae archaeon]|jgi:O-acetyl-ADP-ribose deacetylase (regulator of RNase III)|nr:macro domain-containing protein [Candidatus Methanorudis spinitermitis]